MKFSKVFAISGFAAVAMSSAFATLFTQSVTLNGTTSFDGWDSNAFTTMPGVSYPGFAAWPNPIDSNVAGSGDAVLDKAGNGPGGGPYTTGTTVYHGGTSTTPNTLGGSLYVQDGSALGGVSTIVFQLIITDAFNHDFYNGVGPSLIVNGSATPIEATFSHELDSEDAGSFGGEAMTSHLYAYQWDVSGLGVIDNFEIAWSSVQHARILGLQLDQSTAVHEDYFETVPEPGTMVALSAGVLALLRRRKNRRA